MISIMLTIALVAGAQAADKPVAVTNNTSTNDPIVCETTEQLGSLIRKKRVCLHRSEWQAQRQSDRQEIERQQLQIPTSGH